MDLGLWTEVSNLIASDLISFRHNESGYVVTIAKSPPRYRRDVMRAFVVDREHRLDDSLEQHVFTCQRYFQRECGKISLLYTYVHKICQEKFHATNDQISLIYNEMTQLGQIVTICFFVR